MKNKIVGILVCLSLIITIVPSVTATVTACKIPSIKEVTKAEIFKEIEGTEGKILIVDEIIGSRHVKYWEHAIDDIFVKNDFILLHMNIENGDILKYERSWTDADMVLSDSVDLVFEPDNYFWKKKVFFTDEDDCTYFYTFYDSQVYPLACWEVRFTDGQTILHSFDGDQIGHGIPAPSNGFSLSGYHTPSWPDPWIDFRLNADYWFSNWCTSTVGIPLPTPSVISSYVQDPDFEYFFELAHGDEWHFQADTTGSYYYASNPLGFNVQDDMTNRQPMWFAFIGSCHGMTTTGPGTFSYEFRKGEMTNTTTIGYDHMESCPGWSVALPWQDYMFQKMYEGNTIKDSFDQACAYYPTIAPCVVFVGDTNLKIHFPPDTPSVPSGPTIGKTGITYTYSTSTTDPNGDQIYYNFSWGDDTYSDWLGPYDSGEIITASHVWIEEGNYKIQVKAKDVHDAVSNWSDSLLVTMENIPPDRPEITGPTDGGVGVSYDYTFVATDPNGDQLEYYIEWGDGNIEDWFGPFDSGDPQTVSHTWSEEGTYTIKAKAKDTHDAKSSWGTLSVTMPRNRAITSPFLNFLQNHPILFQLFQRLLKL